MTNYIKVVLLPDVPGSAVGSKRLGAVIPAKPRKGIKCAKDLMKAFYTTLFSDATIEKYRIKEGDFVPFSINRDGFTLHFDGRVRAEDAEALGIKKGK